MTTIAYLADARCSKYGQSGIDKLKNDLNQIVSLSPTGTVDAIVFVGDMDLISQTLQAINASNVKNIPYYFVAGNHELETSADKSALRARYSNYLNYKIDVGDIHICIINEYWDGGTNDSYFKYGCSDGGYIHANLTQWVSNDLAATTKTWKIVCGHEPLYPYGNHVGNSLDRDIINRNAFQTLMVSKGVSVFVGGHTHYGGISKHGDVYHANAGNCGEQAGGSGQDDFSSIIYTHNSGNDLILTWKHESPSWSTPSTTTYTIEGEEPPCVPNWQCEIPLNGHEFDGCGNRRLNSACDPPVANWQCEIPLNGYEADGLGNRRLNSACDPAPVANWQCESPLNGYEYDGLGNRRRNKNCNPPVPSWPYSIEGTVNLNGTIQVGMTVTIQNLTKVLNGTCITNSQGRYFYDDIQDNTIQAEIGDIIRICTTNSGDSSVTFTAGIAEEKVIDLWYILHPHPEWPYSVEGTVIYYDVLQENLMITVRNLTKGTSGTCYTDSATTFPITFPTIFGSNHPGWYMYDDICDSIILAEPGDLINVGTPDGATQSFTAIDTEEKIINFINLVMWGGLWKVVISPASGGTYTFQNNDGILSSGSLSLQIGGMGSFDIDILNDDGVYNSLFEIGDTFEIWLDSELGVLGQTKRLTGIVKTVEFIRNDVSNNIISLTGFDQIDEFKRIIVNEVYRGSRSYEDVITNFDDGLLALYASDISGSGIQKTNKYITSNEMLKFTHTSLYDCISNIQKAVGDWVFYISPTNVLTLEPRGNTDPNKEIIEFDDVNFKYDDSKMANRVVVIGGTDANKQSKVMWTVDASNNRLEANHAIDESYVTGWDSGIAQAAGQWYKLDMHGLIVVGEMFLNNATTYPTKYPRNFKVSASSDNILYDEIVTVQANTSPDVIVSFPKNYYRYIKIEIMGADTANWAIGEISIYTYHTLLAQYEDLESVSNHGLYEVVIKDNLITTKGQCFSRAVAEVKTRKDPIISGSINLKYYFEISPNELLTVTVPGTPISRKFVVQKVTMNEGNYGSWSQSIQLRSES